ncbi:MAG: MFS transporter [Hyphomicrobiaceae bacterium]|nr:MFS transporter [Hyphomicrobiaceae bacterium]
MSQSNLMMGAVLLLCFTMNMLARGATEVFAVFLLPVERALGASRSEMTAVYSLFMLVIGLGGPLAGTTFDKLGARASYCTGLVLLGASLYLAGSITAVWQYALTVGLAAGLGVCLLSMITANALLSRWYEARLGTAIGIAYAASGLGILIMAPVAQLMIVAYGWRDSYRIIGGALVVAAALTAVLPLTRMSRGSPAWQERHGKRNTLSSGWSVAGAIRTRTFWALFCVYMLTSLASFAVTPQSVAAMVEAGIAPLAAAGAFGLSGMLSLIGNSTIAPLVDRFGQRLMLSLSYLGTIIGILCLAALPYYPSMALVYAWAILFGINQGTRGPIISTITATLFAGGGVGRIYGTMALGMGGGAAAGSWASGLLHDYTSSYLASFTLAALCAAVGMMTFWTVPLLSDARRINEERHAAATSAPDKPPAS